MVTDEFAKWKCNTYVGDDLGNNATVTMCWLIYSHQEGTDLFIFTTNTKDLIVIGHRIEAMTLLLRIAKPIVSSDVLPVGLVR